jgi:hypothetical protein
MNPIGMGFYDELESVLADGARVVQSGVFRGEGSRNRIVITLGIQNKATDESEVVFLTVQEARNIAEHLIFLATAVCAHINAPLGGS